MNDYLNTLTVKALREIAKQIGFRFISRYRKTELVNLIMAEIDACHVEAIREDVIRIRQSAPKVSPLDFPVVSGGVVTEAHVKLCQVRGHAQYSKNGAVADFCPRCGADVFADDTLIDSENAVSDFVEMKDPRNFDSVSALKEMIAAMKPLADKALAACEATSSGPVRDMHYQTYQDMTRAMGEMMRSLAYWDEVPEHVCSFQREVGMSGCSYGCKIYRCEGCGEDREIHNATYGCKG